MIATLREQAERLGAPAVVVTFEPPPIELLRPDRAPPRLMLLDRKSQRLKQAGADYVLALRTDAQLLQQSAEEFFSKTLNGALDVRGLVEGPNFRFGKAREGDVQLLQTYCDRAGVPLTVIQPQEFEGCMISSSLVREFVASGELREAATLLGRPHEAIGTVGRGVGRGAKLGFPTANLVGVATLLPPDGVYAGRTRHDGQTFALAVHLGANRTFGEHERNFEAHVLDFKGDLYGNTLRVEFLEKIRESQRFESSESLVAQMTADVERIRGLVAASS
jgi:riboflavin kinase/FMN adenylyltransferase